LTGPRGASWQLAASGFNVALVARREALLEEAASELARFHGVACRVIAADLSAPDPLRTLLPVTHDLDIGLVVSNAGTGNPGRFLSLDTEPLAATLRLNTLAHFSIARHFAPKLAARGRGGLLFVGAMGAIHGIPFMANDAGAKAYVQSFAQSLHAEFAPLGVHVTVLVTPPTDTPVLARFGIRPSDMPIKPITAERCVSEALDALAVNRSVIIPGRLNRIMNRALPGFIVRRLMKGLFAAALANKGTPAHGH
jgi:uncharacterized protein